MPGVEPRGQVGAALIERKGFVIREIVGVAHKGVDGTDGIALVSGQRDKGVIKILRLLASDLATDPVGFVNGRRWRGGWRRGHAAFPFELRAAPGARPLPRNFPVSARSKSAALRDFEITGRLRSTL